MGVNKLWELSGDIIWSFAGKSVYHDVSLHAKGDNSTRPKVAAVCSSSTLSHYSVILMLNVFLFAYSHTVYIRHFWTGRKASPLFLEVI